MKNGEPLTKQFLFVAKDGERKKLQKFYRAIEGAPQ